MLYSKETLQFFIEIIFFDAIPDIYLGIRARAGILIVTTLYCCYWSFIMTNDPSYWQDAEIEAEFGSKKWLLSDIYTSAFVNITIMVAKHTLSTIVWPHKYVLLVSPIGRKCADVSKETYIRDWETRKERESQIDSAIRSIASEKMRDISYSVTDSEESIQTHLDSEDLFSQISTTIHKRLEGKLRE